MTFTTLETPTQLGAFLDTLRYNVVEASNPRNIVNPLPLTEAEAESIANDLIDCTGVEFVVIAISEPEDIYLGDVQPGDIIEVAHTAYRVTSIIPDTLKGGYRLETARCSDGWQSRTHSLYIGKFVTLLSR